MTGGGYCLDNVLCPKASNELYFHKISYMYLKLATAHRSLHAILQCEYLARPTCAEFYICICLFDVQATQPRAGKTSAV